MTAIRFATCLNSFASRPHAEWPDLTGKPSMLQMAARAAKVAGLTDLDLNFPDHVGERPAQIAWKLGDLGLSINGFAMRYYSNPAFKLGAFTNPDPAVRREAINLTKAGIDATRETGANLMTLWLGQDGFDYAFQADYATLWQHEIDGIREVAAHDPDCQISLEYKPNEPRSYSLMPDAATTLLAISDQSQRRRQSLIYTLPIAGGAPELVTKSGPSYWHGWSPDGKMLAFCGERGGEFDTIHVPVAHIAQHAATRLHLSDAVASYRDRKGARTAATDDLDRDALRPANRPRFH